MILSLTFIVTLSMAGNLYSQNNNYSVGGFIDEDGDGFNDLLPDADGDGVPDGLDPDSGPNSHDSSYMHRYMQNYMEQHQMMWQDMNGWMTGGDMEHGEPGMYGPGDSTMHGGHMGGGMGGHMGGGGGMGPGGGGGMGGGMDQGGGMGPGGGGMDPGGGMGPDSSGMGGGPHSVGSHATEPATNPVQILRETNPPEQKDQLQNESPKEMQQTPEADAPGRK